MGGFSDLVRDLAQPFAQGMQTRLVGDYQTQRDVEKNVLLHQLLMPLALQQKEAELQLAQKYTKPSLKTGKAGDYVLNERGDVVRQLPQAPKSPMEQWFENAIAGQGQPAAAPTGPSSTGEPLAAPGGGNFPIGPAKSPFDTLFDTLNPNWKQNPSIFMPGLSGGKLSVRPATNPGVLNPGQGEYSRERRSAEAAADQKGLTDPAERSDFIAGHMAGYRQKQAFAQGQGTTLGSNTGPALDAKGNASYVQGWQSTQGQAGGNLAPLGTPPPTLGTPKSGARLGEPTGLNVRNVPGAVPGEPAATTVTKAKTAGQGIEAASKKQYSELYALKDTAGVVKDLTGDFTKGYSGPVHNIWASGMEKYGADSPLANQLFGGISGEERQVRVHMQSMRDSLLRARSGAQINEQEYARLANFLPGPELPESTNRARLAAFERELDIIIGNRQSVEGATQGEFRQGVGPQNRGATLPQGTQSPPPDTSKSQYWELPNGGGKKYWDATSQGWRDKK